MTSPPAIGADEVRASRREVGEHLEIDRATADDDEEAIEGDRLLHSQISRSKCAASRWGGPDYRT